MVGAHERLVIPSFSRDLGSAAIENNQRLPNCTAKML
jgi:hypothetical protein